MKQSTGSKHKHHIMPKHRGGTNHPDNLVEVSVEEHAEIHRCLWVYGGRWQDEIAWRMLSGQINGYEATVEANRRAKLGKNNPNYGNPEAGYFTSQIAIDLNKKRLKAGTHNFIEKHICPKCCFTGKGAIMFKWHFENCIPDRAEQKRKRNILRNRLYRIQKTHRHALVIDDREPHR